ncbi:MAG: sulfotransferase [Actinomycetota bacterium]
MASEDLNEVADGGRPLVFGIGLNKTGTISLHEALETLGYRSLHWGGPASRVAVERALREGAPLLTYLGDYNAFSDIQRLSVSFDLLDEQYPGSRFVLTTRSLEGWLDSRRRHVERNRLRIETGEYDGTFLEVDLEAWTSLYREHHERVRAYFRDRPNDLLVMDITAGDDYQALCPFLGLPEPATPFPWRHRNAPVQK